MSPELAAADPPPGALDEVIAEYLEGEERGDPCDRGALLARYPGWAADLTAFFTDHDRLRTLAAPLRDITPRPAPAVVAGQGVGGYEVLGEIARGGMGVVYRARQVRLGRVVALKMILAAGPAPADLRRRFQAEAEAAARLDHPNIVPVYEVGEADGRPYYTMRLVPGRNLADHLGGRPAPPAAAARVMAAVARAVGYAHDRGVLHRDLKPANVLIEDGTGAPYVADFGLAYRAADAGRLTPPGCALGTPAYLAPELIAGAVGRPAEPTVGGDVYALGAILYECLTGRPPFRAATPFATLLEAARAAPPRPRGLVPAVPADLETVCLKCLEKDPARRYPRAADLADDLDRWQRGEPVSARPVGPAARFARWGRRHPVVATLAAGLAASVLVGSAAFYWQWRLAEASYRAAEWHRETAEAREREAEANFRLAHDAVGRFYDRYYERYLKDQPAFRPARKDLLTDARRYFERFAAERGDDPTLRRELAAAHFRIAAIDHTNGAVGDALAGYGRALALYEAAAAATPDDPKVNANLARTLSRFASVQAAVRSPAEALPTYGRARALFEALARAEPDDPAHLVDLAVLLNNIGNALRGLGRPDEARRHYEEKIAVCDRLRKRWPDHPDAAALLAGGFLNLAAVASATGAPEAYPCCCETAAEVLEDDLRRHPDHTAGRLPLVRALRFLASDHCARREPAGALAALARARPHLDALVAADPAAVGSRIEESAHHRQVGHARLIAGDTGGAVAAYDRACRATERVPADADSPEYRRELANCYFDLGVARDRQGEWDAAVAAFRRAAAVLTAGPVRPGPPDQQKLGLTLKNLAVLHARRGRAAEAAELYGRAVAAFGAAVQSEPGPAGYRRALAACYASWAEAELGRGEFAAAVTLTGRRRDVFPDDPAALTAVAREFARIADRDPAGLPAEAADACRRAADGAVAALLAAAARGSPDYARVRQEPAFTRLRDRLPATPPPGPTGSR